MAKARVLAVDDQLYFRVFLEDLLTAEGYEVRTANGGEEALHWLERDRFDVVLTDLMMPGLTGVELVERVKERWPDLDVVVVTSVGDVRTAVDAMRRGATDYLLKPIDRTILSRSLEALLQRRRLRQEHSRLMAENLEYLAVLSLYERAMGLLSTLSLEPLAERIVEGLCLETRAQGGLIWVAQPTDPERLRLVAARGLVRPEAEPEELVLERLPETLAPLGRPEGAAFLLAGAEGDGEGGARTLGVPLRHAGRTVGFARLEEKLAGQPFDERDRIVAERFAEPAALAVANALRFRALERRSFRDPTTKAYTWAYFEDFVRNEIRKASRFGRAFSIVRLELEGVSGLRRGMADPEFAAWLERLAFCVGRVLRTTDLLAEETESRYAILLPETDALGAAILKRRIREIVETSENAPLAPHTRGKARLHLAAASYPIDGTQLEQLLEVLTARLAEDRASLLHELDLTEKPFPSMLDALAERARPLEAGSFDQILRFVLAELDHRSAERGVIALAPGAGRLAFVRERLGRLDPSGTRTEVVLVDEGRADAVSGAPVTCISAQRAGTTRPFLIYYAEGPAYALVAEPGRRRGEVRLFHTADRVLVEQLAFQLQRDLGVPIGR